MGNSQPIKRDKLLLNLLTKTLPTDLINIIHEYWYTCIYCEDFSVKLYKHFHKNNNEIIRTIRHFYIGDEGIPGRYNAGENIRFILTDNTFVLVRLFVRIFDDAEEFEDFEVIEHIQQIDEIIRQIVHNTQSSRGLFNKYPNNSFHSSHPGFRSRKFIRLTDGNFFGKKTWKMTQYCKIRNNLYNTIK